MRKLLEEEVSLLISQMKRNDSIDIAYPLVDNKSLAKFVHAWPFAGSVLKRDLWLEDGSLPIDTIWSGCSWETSKVSFLTGMTEVSVLMNFSKARSFRMIYPDGTVSGSVRQFLMIETGAALAKNKRIILKGEQRKPKDKTLKIAGKDSVKGEDRDGEDT